MSLEETSKLLEESRKIVEENDNSAENTSILLTWYFA